MPDIETTEAAEDSRILRSASSDSDDWNDDQWAAWFRTAERAHGDGQARPPLFSRVGTLMARVAELETALAATKAITQKLVDGWKQASSEHGAFAKSEAMNEYPGLADKQEGRSLQLLDCADELADVLKGEDPDDWEYGIGVDVVDRGERAPDAAS